MTSEAHYSRAPSRVGAARQGASSGNVLGVGSMLLWAAGFPAAEHLLETWPPLTLITVRFFLAVSLLIPIWFLLDGRQRVFGARWTRGLGMGGICFGFGAFLLLLAQSYTDPVTVALIASTCPIAGAIIEIFTGQRRLSVSFGLGFAASVCGGYVATASGGLSIDLGLGALCAALSCFLFAWGSFSTVRDFPELSLTGRSTIVLTGGSLMTALLLGLATVLGFDMMPTQAVTPEQMGMLAIYAVAGMALSQVLYIACVGRLGIALAAFHTNAAPFYVMVIMVSLGAAWSWPQAIGALIVGGGVILAQRG